MAYSGNLNDFADIVCKIEGMDFPVSRSIRYHDYTRCFEASLAVFTVGGGFVANTSIVDTDIDILYIKSTDWLRKVYRELQNWK